jgi:hypothetical protein
MLDPDPDPPFSTAIFEKARGGGAKFTSLFPSRPPLFCKFSHLEVLKRRETQRPWRKLIVFFMLSYQLMERGKRTG